VHYKFKRFQQSTKEAWRYEEIPGLLKMTISQFFEYLEQKKKAVAKGGAATDDDTKMKLSKTTLDVVKDVVYMIDGEMARIAQNLLDKFNANFKMKKILPGGEWCMTNAVSDHLSVPSLLYMQKTVSPNTAPFPLTFSFERVRVR
jgi:hypothetical protein